MTVVIVLFIIVLLVLLISWGKLNAFLAFLIVSITGGLMLGIPPSNIVASVSKGIGDTLGSLLVIICLGAMLGKLVAETGAAQKITEVLMNLFGAKHIQWALMVTGFIIGIPLFYNVGFVLMVPLIFSVVYQYKLPAVYIGLPMLAALSVTHGFLPPHPSPSALVGQFHANLGKTLLYGIFLAIPAIILAGPVFAKTLKNLKAEPLQTFQPRNIKPELLPGAANSFLTSLFPVIALLVSTILLMVMNPQSSAARVVGFFGDPSIVMLIAVLVATFSIGRGTGMSISKVMSIYADAVKDIGLILLIVAGAGALKQVFTDSGVSNQVANLLRDLSIHPLILAWLIASIIRVCVGSATVAGLTTAGIIAPVVQQSNVDPNLMVLSIGAGSLMFSHVNDAGFWLFKEYFNLSIRDTIRSWSIMETIVAVVGLGGVLLLNLII
jgi:Gnt-I system high-affinity gluconate transporter